MSYSKHGFIGRLTKDPEVKEIQIGGQPVKVANFTVAVDEDGKSEDTDFYDVVAWRALAENVERFLGKGRLVFVEGRPKKRSYNKQIQGQDVTIYVTEIRADKVQFLDRAPEGQAAATRPQAQPQQTYAQPQQQAYQPQTGAAPF